MSSPCLLTGERALFYKDRFVENLSSIIAKENNYKGACAILASGPSVDSIPEELYQQMNEKVDFIGVNGSIRKFISLGIRPKHYVITDRKFVKNKSHIVELAMNKSSNFFCTVHSLNKILESNISASLDNICIFDTINNAYGLPSYSINQMSEIAEKFEGLYFSNKYKSGISINPRIGVFDNFTVVIHSIQLAFMMGYRQIYIFGMDLTVNNGLRFYVEENGKEEKSFVERDYEKHLLPWFKFFAEKPLGDEYEIYNGSINSRLPNSVIKKIGCQEIASKLELQ